MPATSSGKRRLATTAVSCQGPSALSEVSITTNSRLIMGRSLSIAQPVNHQQGNTHYLTVVRTWMVTSPSALYRSACSGQVANAPPASPTGDGCWWVLGSRVRASEVVLAHASRPSPPLGWVADVVTCPLVFLPPQQVMDRLVRNAHVRSMPASIEWPGGRGVGSDSAQASAVVAPCPVGRVGVSGVSVYSFSPWVSTEELPAFG